VTPGWLVCLATVIITGTASPVGIPEGTTALTWYKPENPGVSPLYCTGAGWPPILTVVGFTVVAKGAGWPSVAAVLVAPRPVQ
jgi:hypothetical protein